MAVTPLYDRITDAILACIDDAGEWQPPWRSSAVMPENGVTGVHYRGINVLLLWAAQIHHGYQQPRWATYKSWQQAGCQVRRGERSTLIAYFEKKVREKDGETELHFINRSFLVFNAAQVDGPLAEPPQRESRPIGEKLAAAELTIEQTGARIAHGAGPPCYIPSRDEIRMPHDEDFRDREAYYATLFHELGHWTGHSKRLDRKLVGAGIKSEIKAYAFEELVAELSAAFLCAHHGMRQELKENHAAYLKNWLTALRNDKSFIIKAAGAAQRAADFVVGGQRVSEGKILEAAE
jgi:antirestriction protein ArdC